MANGSLPSQAIRALAASGAITSVLPLGPTQIQPASIDLTVGTRGWRIAASFLPQHGETVEELAQRFALYELDLSKPVILERDAIYLFEANESLALPENVVGATENKSSTGRIDLLTRLVLDHTPRFDRIPAGYRGKLYLEVTPRSFLVRIASGIALNQLRFFEGNGNADDVTIRALHAKTPLLLDEHGTPLEPNLDGGILLTLDLARDIVGYRARRTNAVLSLIDAPSAAEEFFEPIHRRDDGSLLLRKDDFYILASRERFRVPPEYSVQMAAYDTASGEFRSHYAGFFDPGFGYGDGSIQGASAVLEVRAHGDDFLLRHGQPVCKMVFTAMRELPDLVYGASKALGTHYAAQQGPRLSKYVA